MRKIIFTTLLAVLLTAAAISGQVNAPDRNDVPFPNTPNDRTAGPRTGRGVVVSSMPDPRSFPPISGERMAAIAEASAENAKFIPPMEYIRKYYTYATSPGMGLTRIFPDKNCGTGTIVTVAELERCADVPQRARGGSLFSFKAQGLYGLKKNSWILHFADGRFMFGNDIVQAVAADLGDVDIEAVDLKHEAFKFLKGYDPQQKTRAILEQQKLLAAGISADGYTFTNSTPVKAGSTYAVRAVIYRYHEEGAPIPNRGFDQYVVFKVVGIEPDGSVVIIWKELDRQYPRRKISDN
jgi:hypothetical protein